MFLQVRLAVRDWKTRPWPKITIKSLPVLGNSVDIRTSQPPTHHIFIFMNILAHCPSCLCVCGSAYSLSFPDTTHMQNKVALFVCLCVFHPVLHLYGSPIVHIAQDSLPSVGPSS